MRRKHKLTGCARFIIFLLIFAPIAYLVGSYINGEDGIEKAKNILGLGEEKTRQIEQKSSKESDLNEIIKMKDQEIELLKKKIEELETQNSQ